VAQEFQWKKLQAPARRPFPGVPKAAPAKGPQATPGGPVDSHSSGAQSGLSNDQSEIAEHSTGYDAGFAEGREEGFEVARQEQLALLESLQACVQETSRLRSMIVEQSLQDMSAALYLMFREIFSHELAINPQLVHALVEELRKALQAEGRLQLALGQQDYEQVAGLAGQLSDLDLQLDPSLTPGVVRGLAGKAVYEMDVFANLASVLSRAARELDAQRVEAEIHSMLENSVPHETGAGELPVADADADTRAAAMPPDSETGPDDDAG